MARKADLFHLTPGYAAVGADVRIKCNPLWGKATVRHNRPEGGGHARQGLPAGASPLGRRHVGGREMTGHCIQGDKECQETQQHYNE